MKKLKGILISLVGLIIVVGALAGIKGLQIESMVAHSEAFVPPPETVSVVKVRAEAWESVLTAVGSLQAVQGVVITAELPGRVSRIDFEPGTAVEAGKLLVQQDVSVERAEERAAQTALELARKNYDRAAELLRGKVISKSEFDDRKAALETAAAQLDNVRATIAKKSIRAPFAGRLGIRHVNLGETLEAGDSIVSLQSLDPIYVNFQLPQQQMADLRKGLRVRVSSDTLKGGEIDGIITAINSEVDPATRNISVQATVKNPGDKLRPGMFADVTVVLPHKKQVLAIPVTAVLYAPYGDSVFVVEHQKGADGADGRVVRQQFIKLEQQRGDFVAIRSNLKPGDTVVSTGVFKLRNGQSVVVNNSVAPKFRLKPRLGDA